MCVMNDFAGAAGFLRHGLAAVLVLGIGAGSSPSPGAPYRVETEPCIRLETRAFLLLGTANRTLDAAEIELPAEGDGTWTVRLPPDRPAAAPPSVTLAAAGRPASAGSAHRLELRAEFLREDGVKVRTDRSLDLRDGTTGFFEAGHGPGWRLTLAVTPFRAERAVVRAPSAPGIPILFRVEVGRVVDGAYVALETNELTTFLRQPVAYSFRLGRGDTLEELRLELTPRQVEDDLVEIGVALEGALHAGRDAPLTLSRKDRLFTGRGTTSTVDAVSGEPANGFRFRVTPVW